MHFSVRRWRSLIVPLLAALILTTVPWPCAAEDTRQPAATPGLKASIDSAASGLAADKAAPGPKAAAQAGGDAKPVMNKPFIKSPLGVAMIAILAAGAGYAIYSAHHDRTPVTGR